jgi:peptidoglycan hydrolase CwlO-like protein
MKQTYDNLCDKHPTKYNDGEECITCKLESEIAELTTVKESLTVQVDDLLLEVTSLNKQIDELKGQDNDT